MLEKKDLEWMSSEIISNIVGNDVVEFNLNENRREFSYILNGENVTMPTVVLANMIQIHMYKKFKLNLDVLPICIGSGLNELDDIDMIVYVASISENFKEPIYTTDEISDRTAAILNAFRWFIENKGANHE